MESDIANPVLSPNVKLMRGIFGTTLTASTLMLVMWPLSAQSNTDDPLSRFMACAEIENPPLRYACFDETAAAVKALQIAPTTAIETEEPVSEDAGTEPEGATPPPTAPSTSREKEEKSGLFGFLGGLTKQAKTPEEFGLEEKPEEVEIVTEITGNIADFRITGTGRLIVLLDNGQIWQQISGDSTRLEERIMRRQTSANIETAALGSYLMRLSPSGQSIRVRRIQ